MAVARASRRTQGGQGVTEFALIMPLLLLIACGIFDFGRAVSANVTVSSAARAASRQLATVASSETLPFNQACPTSGTTETAPASTSAQYVAWQQLSNASMTMSSVSITVRFWTSSENPSSAAADVTFTCPAGGTSDGTVQESPAGSTYSASSGDWVQVEIKYTYTPSTPLIGRLMASGVVVDQLSTMVVE